MNERVKVISRDGVQLVELPPGMTLADGEWTVRRQRSSVVLELAAKRGSVEALLALLATWDPIDEEFPEIEDLPPEEPDFAWDESDR